MKISKAVIRLALVLMVLVSLSGFMAVNSVYAAGLSSWANRVQITIDHTKISSTLTNFPILINLGSASGTSKTDVSAIFTTLGNNNKKLTVTTSDGTTQPGPLNPLPGLW